MKKIATVVLSCLFLILFTSSVFARGGTYLALRGGASFQGSTDYLGTQDYDTGYDASVAFGYNYIPGRVEVELGSRSNAFSCGGGTTTCEESSLSLMFNTYAEFYDQHIGGMDVSTFFGGGVGMSRVAFNLFGGDNTDLVFAYQITFGVGHELSDTMSLDVGYRYFATEDPEFQNGAVTIENQGSTIFLGLRWAI